MNNTIAVHNGPCTPTILLTQRERLTAKYERRKTLQNNPLIDPLQHIGMQRNLEDKTINFQFSRD